MTHNDIHIIIDGSHSFGWNQESCMRGYFKHFSYGNSLLPARKVFVPVVKTEKKKKKHTHTKKTHTQKKTTDIVLASRVIQALM